MINKEFSETNEMNSGKVRTSNDTNIFIKKNTTSPHKCTCLYYDFI